MSNIISKQLVIKDLLINYSFNSVADSKYTILFIHGWLSSSVIWHDFMLRLDNLDVKAVALDLPGFGNSQIPSSSVDNNFYVDIVNELINKLNLNNIILVGHSNGGAISVKLINKGNSKIQKLALLSGSGIRKSSSSKSIKNIIAKVVKPVFKINALKPLRAKIYKLMGSEDYVNSEYLQNTYSNIIKDDISDLYKNITIPTLLVWGKYDTATPLEYGEFINNAIKDSEFHVVDSDHFALVNKSDEVFNYLVNFIK